MNRLKEIRAFLGLSQQEMADQIGEKRYRINDMENGKTKIQVDFAELLEEKFNINPWWLLTGKGNMEKKSTEKIELVMDDTIRMPFVRGQAQAGRGNDISDIRYEVVDTMSISRALFKTPPTSTVRIIKVDGYSMIPTLYPDSYCIFDECGRFITDGLYIINYGNELMVKLLQQSPDGKLHIRSTNPDYASWTIDPASDQTHLHIIGKVLRIII